MSVLIEKNATFLGVPLVTVRNVLKAWRHGESDDAHDIAVRKDVNLDPRIVIMLLDELRERSLIGAEKTEGDREFDGVTPAGEALIVAKATKRTTKPKAWAVLRAFLNACAEVNARDDLPFEVQEVWLFGSLIDEERGDVADIDIVPVFGYPAKYDFKTREARFEALTEEMGGAGILSNAGIFAPFRAETYVTNRLLYGVRRHHLLAPNKMDQLLSLACPCKLIFDKSRGGIVDEPVLPRHPKSPGRSNRIGDRREMPNFLDRRQPLRPLPADLTKPGLFHWQTLVESGPWPESNSPYRWIQDRQNASHVVTDRKPIRAGVRENVVRKRLDLTNLDGRKRYGFLVCQRVYPNPNDRWESVEYPSFGIVVERAIGESQTRLRYDIHIADGAQKGRYADLFDVYAAIWWTYLMATADIEHMLRRDAEIGVERLIEVNLTAAIDKPSAIEFAAQFSEHKDALAGYFRSRPGSPEVVFSKLQEHVAALVEEV